MNINGNNKLLKVLKQIFIHVRVEREKINFINIIGHHKEPGDSSDSL